MNIQTELRHEKILELVGDASDKIILDVGSGFIPISEEIECKKNITLDLLKENNPDILYAATWQRQRTVAAYLGGGPGSGLHVCRSGWWPGWSDPKAPALHEGRRRLPACGWRRCGAGCGCGLRD